MGRLDAARFAIFGHLTNPYNKYRVLGLVNLLKLSAFCLKFSSVMKKIYFLLFLTIIVTNENLMAQLPNCSANPATIIYIHSGSSIYNYDVTQPVSATNPSLNTITMPSGAGGLAVSNNLNGPGPSPTFYTSVSGSWWYYNGATWVNTGHSCGSTAAVNSGGGGNYLYNLVGASGQVYQYDGTGNSTLLLTVPGFSGGGPYDLVGNCDGGFYILRTSTNPFLRKYDSNGNLVASWTTTGSASTAGGGFAIVNNTVYYHNTSGFNSAPFTPPSSNLAFSPVGQTIPNPSDMACCRVCDSLLPPPPPNAEFGMSKDSICAGECIVFNDLSTDSPTVWSWTFPGGTPANSTAQNPGIVCFNTPGIHTIELIASNANGSDTVTKQIEVFAVPNAAISGEVDICIGESATLTAQPAGLVYSWDNAAASQSITITPLATTTYQVYVTNVICTDSATHVVNVNPLPVINISSTLTNCDANTGTATAQAVQGTPTYNYAWTGGLIGETINNLGVGTYTVTVTDSKNCSATASVNVGMHPNPVAAITPYPVANVRIGESVQLEATGGGRYQWTPTIYLNCDQCPNPISTPKEEMITYCVDVTDANGCMDTACTTVIVDTSCSYIFIPTAFTPNNDGLNDQISINNTCKIDRLIFRIFNRWGQLVFESRNVNDKWDGTFKGEPQPVSTFHYYLEADLINGRKVRQRGDITLIR